MEASFLQRHPFLKDSINVIVFIVCVMIGTLFINTFVFRSYSVLGPSMESTLYTGDRLIINRLPVTWAQLRNDNYIPERGDIIVFKNPQYNDNAGDEYIVKRVIAFGGERVVLQNGQFTIYNDENTDGFNPDELYEYTSSVSASGSVDKIVPRDELFVVGDHREGSYSYDSRSGLGTIPLYDIIGPVKIRLFPFDAIRTF